MRFSVHLSGGNEIMVLTLCEPWLSSDAPTASGPSRFGAQSSAPRAHPGQTVTTPLGGRVGVDRHLFPIPPQRTGGCFFECARRDILVLALGRGRLWLRCTCEFPIAVNIKRQHVLSLIIYINRRGAYRGEIEQRLDTVPGCRDSLHRLQTRCHRGLPAFVHPA